MKGREEAEVRESFFFSSVGGLGFFFMFCFSCPFFRFNASSLSLFLFFFHKRMFLFI